MQKISIAFIIPVLCGGGAERVIVELAGAFAAQGHAVSLITFKGGAEDAYAVGPGVSRLFIEDAGPVEARGDADWELENVRQLRGALRASGCEVAVSFLARMNMRTLLAARGTGIPVIVSERVDPRRMPLLEAEEILRRDLYPEAATLVVQTERIAGEWGEAVAPRKRIAVIPNMLRRLPLSRQAPPFPQPYVAAAGRLTAQKGFDLLVDAFADVAAQIPGLRLVVAGEGEDREKLLRRARDKGIAGLVHFPGFLSNPGPLFSHARMVVLSSRFEGFPNVLLEAMALGRPVVATDCPTGPREIIRHGEDGLLVENGNARALGQAMLELGRSARMRSRMGKAAALNARRFSPEAVFKCWSALVEAVLQGRDAGDTRLAL